MLNMPRAAQEPAPGEDASPSDPTEEISTEIEERVPYGFAEMVAEAGPYMGILLGAGISALFAVVITLAASTVLTQVFRRRPRVQRTIRRTRRMPYSSSFCSAAPP